MVIDFMKKRDFDDTAPFVRFDFGAAGSPLRVPGPVRILGVGGEPFVVPGDGGRTRVFVHPEDVAALRAANPPAVMLDDSVPGR